MLYASCNTTTKLLMSSWSGSRWRRVEKRWRGGVKVGDSWLTVQLKKSSCGVDCGVS